MLHRQSLKGIRGGLEHSQKPMAKMVLYRAQTSFANHEFARDRI